MKSSQSRLLRPLKKKRLSSPRVLGTIKFYLPPALEGVITEPAYRLWLRKKSLSVCNRDKKDKRPCAQNATRAVYAEKIHEAVCRNPRNDPFTGEALRWDLIRKYDPKQVSKDRDYFRKFSLLPSIDHTNPDAPDLEFELCGMQMNRCKAGQTPSEFIALCRKIASYREKAAMHRKKTALKAPAQYFLPDFLNGVLTLDQYREWIEDKSHHVFVKDQKRRRPCAAGHSCADYKMAIHRAICANGLLDPYSGEEMGWKLVGVLDPDKAKAGRKVFLKRFAMMPTIDHVDPEATDLKLEVCSLMVNECKNNLNADEFVGLCKKVVAFRGGKVFSARGIKTLRIQNNNVINDLAATLNKTSMPRSDLGLKLQ
jgi:hypothetical protein